MPTLPESQPRDQSVHQPEIAVEDRYPALQFSPIAWFNHLLADAKSFYAAAKADPARVGMEDLDPQGIEALEQEVISGWAQALHTMTEEVVCFIYQGASSSEALNDLDCDNVARMQLGQLRQLMIRHGLRPELQLGFNGDYDLSPDGQQLFSLIQDHFVELRDLQTIAADKETGFNLEAAIIELRTWGFLEDTSGNLGLADHPDLRQAIR